MRSQDRGPRTGVTGDGCGGCPSALRGLRERAGSVSPRKGRWWTDTTRHGLCVLQPLGTFAGVQANRWGLDLGKRGPWRCAGTQRAVSALDPVTSEQCTLFDLCAVSGGFSQRRHGHLRVFRLPGTFHR